MASTNMAAMQIKGKVKDSKTGEEIIGAYIVIKEHPSQGTVTGLDGSFNLSVDKPTFTIVCSYMGYKSYEMKISKSINEIVIPLSSDNIMLSDLYIRAKELHVETELNRGVFLIRRLDEHFEGLTVEAVQNIFPDRQTSFALSMGESDVVLIQQLGENVSTRDLEKTAQLIEETLRENGESTVVVGIGTVAAHLRDLAKSYKEAQIAIEVGKVFDTEKTIVSYDNLGIARLIYQLPTTLCDMFMREVFKRGSIDSLDQETLFTIQRFFENNLNVSETSRKLFVHRNTLVYRLEKIKKLTGLDLREFDDAIVFKVALMVKKYLSNNPAKY